MRAASDSVLNPGHRTTRQLQHELRSGPSSDGIHKPGAQGPGRSGEVRESASADGSSGTYHTKDEHLGLFLE